MHRKFRFPKILIIYVKHTSCECVDALDSSMNSTSDSVGSFNVTKQYHSMHTHKHNHFEMGLKSDLMIIFFFTSTRKTHLSFVADVVENHRLKLMSQMRRFGYTIILKRRKLSTSQTNPMNENIFNNKLTLRWQHKELIWKQNWPHECWLFHRILILICRKIKCSLFVLGAFFWFCFVSIYQERIKTKKSPFNRIKLANGMVFGLKLLSNERIWIELATACMIR